ncbi:hypothetical protein ES703_64223 [subsurface metagenome]
MPGGFVSSVFIAFVLGVHGWFCLVVLSVLWLRGLLRSEHSRRGLLPFITPGVLVFLLASSRSELLHLTENQVELDSKGSGLV